MFTTKGKLTMKTYAIFYDANGYWPCGDRSIIEIDGRLRHDNKVMIALVECEKRGFEKFRLVRAARVLDIPTEYDRY